MKYPLLKRMCMRALCSISVVGFSLLSSVSVADEASYSFAPAPANLSGNLNKNKIGLDAATVQVDGASNVSATTFRYLSKSGRRLAHSHNKSLAGINYYLTTMESPDFDRAMAFGFGFDGIRGYDNGSAFIFGTGMDLQGFSASTAYERTDIINMIMHMDFGVQYHWRLGPHATVVPWGKFSYLHADATILLTSQVPNGLGGSDSYSDTLDASSNFTAIACGTDILYRGYSIGAMYQQGDHASVAKLSLSMGF